jgi:choline dehydrogenase-like flavoprotein
MIERLAAVFHALASMPEADARRRARTALDTLMATATRWEVRQLGLALRALDVAPLNWAIGGGWAAFGGSDGPARERILLAWSTSPIPQQRTAFQAWKRLGLFLAYADPGPDPANPANPAWNRLGYRLPEAPPDPPPPSLSPLAVERSGARPLELDVDTVVVGSGAGGGLVAARLAAAGQGVLVVEAGPYHDEAHLSRLEAEAFRDLYLDRGTTSTRDLAITILAGTGLGGGTLINWTTSLPPPDELRRRWAEHHGLTGFDGAEADADLERLAEELQLMPPSVVPPKDQLIIDGGRALGWEAGPSLRNAGPCTACGGCGFGCPSGSKRSGLRSHLAAAADDGAQVLVDARVERIVHRSGRVMGVRGRLATGGRSFAVRARRVVVAAGALRTPILLMRSGIPHPALGRHLRLHPVVAVVARMSDPVEMWTGPNQAARCLEFVRPGPSARDGVGPAHGGFLVESAPPHPGLAAASLPWHGRADNAALLDTTRWLAPILGIVADHGSGRVRPAGDGRVSIDYRLAPADALTGRRALVEMARLARAGGAGEILSIATPSHRWAAGANRPEAFERFLRRLAATDMSPNRISLFSAHQMGSARSGLDPAEHPTDPGGRVRVDRSGRLLAGCYVADASLLPTALGVNPMLTIMAMAERTARAILADAETVGRAGRPEGRDTRRWSRTRRPSSPPTIE